MTDPQLLELIAEAREDEVGLWLVISKVRDELGLSDDHAVRESTISCVRQLLDSGQVDAGYYKPDGTGVEIWDLGAGEVISRIESRWEALGREPDIGEVVVLVGSRRPPTNGMPGTSN